MGATYIRARWAFLLVAPLLTLLAGSCAQESAQDGPASFAEAKRLAAAAGKPILVDFFADW